MEEFDTMPCFYSNVEDSSIDLDMNQSNVTMCRSAERWDDVRIFHICFLIWLESWDLIVFCQTNSDSYVGFSHLTPGSEMKLMRNRLSGQLQYMFDLRLRFWWNNAGMYKVQPSFKHTRHPFWRGEFIPRKSTNAPVLVALTCVLASIWLDVEWMSTRRDRILNFSEKDQIKRIFEGGAFAIMCMLTDCAQHQEPSTWYFYFVKSQLLTVYTKIPPKSIFFGFPLWCGTWWFTGLKRGGGWERRLVVNIFEILSSNLCSNKIKV